MPQYIPSTRDWVREQVEVYEKSGGKDQAMTSAWRSSRAARATGWRVCRSVASHAP